MIYSFAKLPEQKKAAAGGKGRVLSELFKKGFPVPDGFIITSEFQIDEQQTPDFKAELKKQINRIRKKNTRFAVRSSALNEDSADLSFAGEYDTVLGNQSDDEIYKAIVQVSQSARNERVQSYSKVHSVEESPVAIVVQTQIEPDYAGVLFTINPVTGDYTSMSGNYVQGLGEDLVSGDVKAKEFTFNRNSGEYAGPDELKPAAAKLYKTAEKLVALYDRPQDIEWAVKGNRVFLLQARPVTSLGGVNPITEEHNDSLSGKFLWTNTNTGEAVPDVMTPAAWSMWELLHIKQNPVKTMENIPMIANICGRPYFNLSLSFSIAGAFGMSRKKAQAQLLPFLGDVSEDIEIPRIPVRKWATLKRRLPQRMEVLKYYKQYSRRFDEMIRDSVQRCHQMMDSIQTIESSEALLKFWEDQLSPFYFDYGWLLKTGLGEITQRVVRIRKQLSSVVDESEMGTLLSGFGGAQLESLGPLIHIQKVAVGQMTREEYLRLYGHRSPSECEISKAYPCENPEWLEQRIAESADYLEDPEKMIARQHKQAQQIVERLKMNHPRLAKKAVKGLSEISSNAIRREKARSEFTRGLMVIRRYFKRAGELLGLGDDVFFLSLDEVLECLGEAAIPEKRIQKRKKNHERYCSYPQYPSLLTGRFDPEEWQVSQKREVMTDHKTLTGIPGAAGVVTGTVRVLKSMDESHTFIAGEILVAATTNVGWTPVFPKAGAVVTDVGAPLSHAAIVAREMGLPAVVGCNHATRVLKTGDKVCVDGGKGIVHILTQATGV